MQSTPTDRDVAVAAHTRSAFKELYLVSGAAAQLGAYGLQVQEVQWQALARASNNASAVLGARHEHESETAAAFRQLAALCDDLLDRRALGHACPSAIWRDLARAGRDAYERMDT
ncbi:hypothetical protein [Trinickia sp.]|uniref:hypothetical protein n=1 Tax=Trinickia sp. TaxID=2571163 RepID=UPI003F7D71E5